MTWSMSWQHTNLLCGCAVHGGEGNCSYLLHRVPHTLMLPWHWPRHKRRGYRIITVVLAKHKMTPWWWFLREPKHVGATIGILIVLIFLWFYNCVHHCGTIKSALILLMHGTNMKIMYIGVHVKYPIFLSDCNDSWFFDIFSKNTPM
jgi:hypothetical protein